MLKNQYDSYSVKFSIKYHCEKGQNIFIYGNIPELGSWKESKFKLKWKEGHIWKGKLDLPANMKYFTFKYVCISEDGKFIRWEKGPDRVFDCTKFSQNENFFKLYSSWETFSIIFNIYYPLKNEIEYLEIIGEPHSLGNWLRDQGSPIRMYLSEVKTLGGTFIILT
jgi:hypothetical protein